jgi:hypothetical protein
VTRSPGCVDPRGAIGCRVVKAGQRLDPAQCSSSLTPWLVVPWLSKIRRSHHAVYGYAYWLETVICSNVRRDYSRVEHIAIHIYIQQICENIISGVYEAACQAGQHALCFNIDKSYRVIRDMYVLSTLIACHCMEGKSRRSWLIRPVNVCINVHVCGLLMDLRRNDLPKVFGAVF